MCCQVLVRIFTPCTTITQHSHKICYVNKLNVLPERGSICGNESMVRICTLYSGLKEKAINHLNYDESTKIMKKTLLE